MKRKKACHDKAKLIRLPSKLRDEMAAESKRLGISAAEAWRRAAEAWLREDDADGVLAWRPTGLEEDT